MHPWPRGRGRGRGRGGARDDAHVGQTKMRGRYRVYSWSIGTFTMVTAHRPLLLTTRCFARAARVDPSARRRLRPTSGSVGDGGENVVNVPLRGTGFGDADYYYVFEHVVIPLAAQRV